jgi:hypothetical protein
MDEQQAADEAYRYLRSHSRGDLRFDQLFEPVRYVMGPEGNLVWPANHAILEALDTVLYVPEDRDGAMEILVTQEELDPDGPRGALADRWRIYHGDPHEAWWALATIDTARYEGMVVDGIALIRTNPLAGAESRLCRVINQTHREDLRAVCAHFAKADVETPLLVGVDPLGFDVRRRFDVVRVEAPEPMATAEAVEATFARMLQESAA